MNTETYTQNHESAILLEETSDPQIRRVRGRSDDFLLVQYLGRQLNNDRNLKNITAIQFDDATKSVVKARGSDEYTTRAPRSSSQPPGQSAIDAFNRLNAETAAKRAAIREQVISDIARKREELTQLERMIKEIDEHTH